VFLRHKKVPRRVRAASASEKEFIRAARPEG
jgi:hypothetical protein